MKTLSLFWVFSLLAGVAAHAAPSEDLVRPQPPVYEYSVENNQSGLQKSEIEQLIRILDLKFGSRITNSSKAWYSDFDWERPHLAAGSNDYEGNFTVLMWGGILRAKAMNFGSAAALFCHELGHKLGGEPRQIFQNEVHWSSAEGQSDHFAATQCLPQVYDELKARSPEKIKSQKPEPIAQKICSRAADPRKCQWIATSGIDLMQSLQLHFDLDIPIQNPDLTAPEKVAKTLHTQYPTYACRMDIFKFGALNPQAPRLPCWFRETQ